MEEETNQNTNKNKILSLLIGDIEKWKKMPQAMKQLEEDLKTNQKWGLIAIFILFLALALSFMGGVYWVQTHAQYCYIGIDGFGEKMQLAKVYEEEIYGQENIYCKFDFKKFCEDYPIC